MRKAEIYVLIDPRNNHIRYVGGTIQGLSIRLCSHISLAKRQPYNILHTSNWIRSLLKINLKPTVKLLWVCEGETYYDEEVFWIAFYRINGCNLTNLTDGGEGCIGRKVSTETREKLRLSSTGKKYSIESKEKMRQSKLGKKHSPDRVEANRKRNTGRKQTPESIAKTIATKKANGTNKHSFETKEKLRVIKTGFKHSKESIEKMKNKPGPNKGKVFSKEARKNMSLSHVGKKQSKEQIDKRVASIKLTKEKKLLQISNITPFDLA